MLPPYGLLLFMICVTPFRADAACPTDPCPANSECTPAGQCACVGGYTELEGSCTPDCDGCPAHADCRDGKCVCQEGHYRIGNICRQSGGDECRSADTMNYVSLACDLAEDDIAQFVLADANAKCKMMLDITPCFIAHFWTINPVCSMSEIWHTYLSVVAEKLADDNITVDMSFLDTCTAKSYTIAITLLNEPYLAGWLNPSKAVYWELLDGIAVTSYEILHPIFEDGFVSPVSVSANADGTFSVSMVLFLSPDTTYDVQAMISAALTYSEELSNIFRLDSVEETAATEGTCTFEDVEYRHGIQFRKLDNCNRCVCNNGVTTCSEIVCSAVPLTQYCTASSDCSTTDNAECVGHTCGCLHGYRPSARTISGVRRCDKVYQECASPEYMQSALTTCGVNLESTRVFLQSDEATRCRMFRTAIACVTLSIQLYAQPHCMDEDIAQATKDHMESLAASLSGSVSVEVDIDAYDMCPIYRKRVTIQAKQLTWTNDFADKSLPNFWSILNVYNSYLYQVLQTAFPGQFLKLTIVEARQGSSVLFDVAYSLSDDVTDNVARSQIEDAVVATKLTEMFGVTSVDPAGAGCIHNDVSYGDGDWFIEDGCNTCICSNGELVCPDMDCDNVWLYQPCLDTCASTDSMCMHNRCWCPEGFSASFDSDPVGECLSKYPECTTPEKMQSAFTMCEVNQETTRVFLQSDEATRCRMFRTAIACVTNRIKLYTQPHCKDDAIALATKHHMGSLAASLPGFVPGDVDIDGYDMCPIYRKRVTVQAKQLTWTNDLADRTGAKFWSILKTYNGYLYFVLQTAFPKQFLKATIVEARQGSVLLDVTFSLADDVTDDVAIANMEDAVVATMLTETLGVTSVDAAGAGCIHNDVSYGDGDWFVEDGCNTCICSNGELVCPDMDCDNVWLYEPCLETTACATKNALCYQNRCWCPDGFSASFDVDPVGECLTILGRECSIASECDLDEADCRGNTCQCIDGFHENNHRCEDDKPLGGACTQSDHCGSANSECRGAVCACKATFYQSGTTCEPDKLLEEACSPNDHCGPANSECRGAVCACKATFYQSGAACEPGKLLEEDCTENYHCGPANSECKNGECACKTTFYKSSTTCELVVPLGQTCSPTQACSTQNAVCGSNSKCTCKTSFKQSGSICKATDDDSDDDTKILLVFVIAGAVVAIIVLVLAGCAGHWKRTRRQRRARKQDSANGDFTDFSIATNNPAYMK